jgi:hypothetical protein
MLRIWGFLWIDLSRKPETKSNCSRLVGYVHSPFGQVSAEAADKLAAGCYRLSPRGLFVGKVDAFIGRPDMPPMANLKEKSRHAILVNAL